MELEDILRDCSALRVKDIRYDSDEYAERVIYRADMDQWIDCVAKSLGPAVKPAGAPPTPNDLSLTKEYGGIAAGQILFHKTCNGASVMVMFWPWNDAVYVTVRIIAVKEVHK